MNFRKTVIFLLVLIVTALPAWAVEITPFNVTMPSIVGDTFSFDLAISDSGPIGVSGMNCKTTISVIPSVLPNGLTFDAAGSEAVESDTLYWIYNNSGGSFAQDIGSDSYTFVDDTYDGNPEDLMSGDIMSRYAFTWDGVAKDYTFTIDLDTANSFVLLADFVSKEAFEFDPGSYRGDSTSFTVFIPEPATLMLLAFGSMMLARKRRS